ncbi:kynureninase [Clohesyomyces aquaticus]|uniref:Kynureninase n=1 Tax=Clohesyomyces aquaticus TaxID=1231657 RepID=A0A1Y1YMJ9_9PLEO|nr:kynureninase [Clohesyomyces aquaticus]
MLKTRNPFEDVDEKKLCSEEFARKEDGQDELRKLRDEFIVPTKADLKNQKYGPAQLRGNVESERTGDSKDEEDAIYLCGNSLGLQPRRTREYINRYLDTWASKGVYGHFKPLEGGHAPWLHIDDAIKEQTAKIVGALPSEVVVMETLTANLHLLMASFYKPTKDRYKIIIEGKAFPSDHVVCRPLPTRAPQPPPSALITISPPSPSDPYLSAEHILSVISQHAANTALVLLPGIQFYSGQFLDINLITRHCHALGITVGWDLAHAVGNVPLQLHDWNIDFAAWCNYKYMNGGPGVIGGLFVHETHGKVEEAPQSAESETTPAAKNTANPSQELKPEDTIEEGKSLTYRPRLSGWWGSSKSTRFAMSNIFVPIPGASGFQLSNPSALDITSVTASLDVFALTSMAALREKSIRLTAYLEARLLKYPYPYKSSHPSNHKDSEQEHEQEKESEKDIPYSIITPSNPAERGAQLSVLLRPGMLDDVMQILEEEGVVVDERRPDVIRVAPVPLYNSYLDVHRFVGVFQEACWRVGGEGKGLGKAEGGEKGNV